MLSTASAPTFTETDSGIIDLKRIDKRAVIIATIANNGKRLVRTVLIFTESSDQLSRATDRVP
ncbi:hypothetical protein MZD79_26995, partial [Escherichia coli]|nr:hypothetical protein [Escherichia coli]